MEKKVILVKRKFVKPKEKKEERPSKAFVDRMGNKYMITRYQEVIYMKLCLFHDWIREEFIEKKINSSGVEVYVYRCRCTKCGKEAIREYII